MAHRCQLITGSFEGNPIACTCTGVDDCKLTVEERDKYNNHPSIIATKESQLELFESLKETA